MFDEMWVCQKCSAAYADDVDNCDTDENGDFICNVCGGKLMCE